MSDPDVATFRERANTAHRARVQSNAAERALARVDSQPRRGRFFRSKREKTTAATPVRPAPTATYTPASYKANELNLSNEMLLTAMARVKTGESMDDVIAGLLDAGTDKNKPSRAATSGIGLRPPPDRRQAPRNQSSAANLAFDRRKAAIRSRAATVQQRKSRAMTASLLQQSTPGTQSHRTGTVGTGVRPPKPSRPTRPPLRKPATVVEESEHEDQAEQTQIAEPLPTPQLADKPTIPAKPKLAPKPSQEKSAGSAAKPASPEPVVEPPVRIRVESVALAADPAPSPPETPAAPSTTTNVAPPIPTTVASAEEDKDQDAGIPLPKREPPPKAKKLQSNKFSALAAMLDARVAANQPPAVSATTAVAPSFPPPPPIPGSSPQGGPPPPPPPPDSAPAPIVPKTPATDLPDLSGDRNAAAYLEDKRRREQRAKAVKMLGVRALAERNRAASIARRDFENEMAAMAGRLRKRNDEKFTKKVEAVEEEDDEDMSPALAAALAKVRAEKKAKDEAALEKIRQAQVLSGDRSAAAFLEAKAERAKAADAKKKLSLKEQAELDRQAEEKRAAFEAEMKARSGNLKKQTTKVSAMSVKDMFAGADMSAVTKFAGGGSNEEDDDGKSDFLKEIERSKKLKATEDTTSKDTELFVGVNETSGDPSGQHALTVVRATGKAITVRWPPWQGDKVSYALLKDGEMMTATEPGESPAATILPLEPKTTYRIKVIALGPEGILGEEFSERNCSTAGTGQTWVNSGATSEAPQLAPKRPPTPPPTPSVKISVLRSSSTSATLVWQPFGGTTIAESKRKCFCVMMNEEVQVVTEQNDKTVAVITDVKPGCHIFRVVALHFDGSPCAESEPLSLEFDGSTPPVIPVKSDMEETTKDTEHNKKIDATKAPSEIVMVVTEVEAEVPYEGPSWAEEFAKMLKVGLPEEMVRMKMAAKDISPADIENFFAALSTPTATESDVEHDLLHKLDRRRHTLAQKETYAAWEAKKQRRMSTAIQRRNIREKIFEGNPESPSVVPLETLSEAEATFRSALSEELEGLSIECETLDGSERAEFENRHISVVLEKIEELPKLAPVVVDEEEYIEDLNDLVDVADQLQLDETVFDTLAAEMDYFDDNDINELAQEFDTIPEDEKRALFGE